MNYRHIYHAGNFADVFKHIVLMRVLSYLRQKDKAFFVLDTHAGIGRYDLDAKQACKTMEAKDGIGRLWNAQDLPPAVADYVALVRDMNAPADRLQVYPGSPAITRAMLRDQDRLVANELHPEDVATLQSAIGHDRRVQVTHQDAYASLKAMLPPPERRGLVLADPPFEVTDEFDRITRGLQQAYQRWATGIYAFWYPIKSPGQIHLFHQDIKDLGIPRCVAFDFMLRPVRDSDTLNGCGMLLVNPPWVLGDEIREMTPALLQHLTGGHGAIRVHEITGS